MAQGISTLTYLLTYLNLATTLTYHKKTPQYIYKAHSLLKKGNKNDDGRSSS